MLVCDRFNQSDLLLKPAPADTEQEAVTHTGHVTHIIHSRGLISNRYLQFTAKRNCKVSINHTDGVFMAKKMMSTLTVGNLPANCCAHVLWYLTEKLTGPI